MGSRADTSVRVYESVLPGAVFRELRASVGRIDFPSLMRKGKNLYHLTCWFPFTTTAPRNGLERCLLKLKRIARPPVDVAGMEWWFSVFDRNRSPYLLLRPHFDVDNLRPEEDQQLLHPVLASVLFLTTESYGELMIFNQIRKPDGSPSPSLPTQAAFIRPRINRYAIFPGDVYHGVIGRLWRKPREPGYRMTLAVNYWTRRPSAAYCVDSLAHVYPSLYNGSSEF